MSDKCPCGSSKSYATCCEPYLSGKLKPATASDLMRSRYTAYAMAAIDYLYRTSGAKIQKEFNAEESRKWAESAEWSGIEMLNVVGGGETDETGTVEFVARYSVNGTPFDHHEISSLPKRTGSGSSSTGRSSGPRRSAARRRRSDVTIPVPVEAGRNTRSVAVRKKCEFVRPCLSLGP